MALFNLDDEIPAALIIASAESFGMIAVPIAGEPDRWLLTGAAGAHIDYRGSGRDVSAFLQGCAAMKIRTKADCGRATWLTRADASDMIGGSEQTPTVSLAWQWCLGHNFSMLGGAFTSYRAGDNRGFHMGEDSGQCTCQWQPGTGKAYVGATPCIEGDPPDPLDEVSR